MEQESTGYELITKLLAGETTPGEWEKIRKWLDESADNRHLFRQSFNIWNNSAAVEALDRVDVNRALDRVMNRVNPGIRRQRLVSFWKNTAAILIIPLLAGSILLQLYLRGSEKPSDPVYNELYAAFGTRSALRLSDGTSVWLNSGSSIRYPDRFRGKERTVYLDGEAYFEVKSDTRHPFMVISKNIRTRATGTKFNVSDYPSSDISEVTLIEGRVDVILPFENDMPEMMQSIEPNQHYSFNRVTGQSSVTETDPYKYYSWKDGKIIFRNEPLSQVVEKIGNIFNVDIEIRGKEIEGYRYRATFEDESLEDILKLLKISSPIDYTESKRVPLPDGSFTKKKITLLPAR
jgi:ferric-dicitrate binding protein FerR (iron transport regulator)